MDAPAGALARWQPAADGPADDMPEADGVPGADVRAALLRVGGSSVDDARVDGAQAKLLPEDDDDNDAALTGRPKTLRQAQR